MHCYSGQLEVRDWSPMSVILGPTKPSLLVISSVSFYVSFVITDSAIHHLGVDK